MEMDILPGKVINSPNPDQINSALQQVYPGHIAGMLLVRDSENQYYIQARPGGHLEYKRDNSGMMYKAEDVPLEMCKKIFLAYAANDSRWKKVLTWTKFNPNDPPQQVPSAVCLMDQRLNVVPKPNQAGVLSIPSLNVIAAILGILLFMSLSSRLESASLSQLMQAIPVNMLWLSLVGIGWTTLKLFDL